MSLQTVPVLQLDGLSAGYDTAAVVSAIVLARRHGLDQGFRLYDDDMGAGYSAGTEQAERQAGPATDGAVPLPTTASRRCSIWWRDCHVSARRTTTVRTKPGGFSTSAQCS